MSIHALGLIRRNVLFSGTYRLYPKADCYDLYSKSYRLDDLVSCRFTSPNKQNGLLYLDFEILDKQHDKSLVVSHKRIVLQNNGFLFSYTSPTNSDNRFEFDVCKVSDLEQVYYQIEESRINLVN